MLEGKATSLLWEPVGEIGFGIEAQVAVAGRLEVHQCKIENAAEGSWSVASLAASGVLAAALRHLQRPGVAEFVFVSRDRAPTLSDLAERSHRADNDPEAYFQEAQQWSGAHQNALTRLCQAWHIDTAAAEGRACVFSLLQRVRFETGIWDKSQRAHLEIALGLAAEGTGADIATHLADELYKSLGHTIHADQIRQMLRQAGHSPRDLRNDPRVAGGIENLRRSFESSLTDLLLGGHLLPRAETQELLRQIEDPSGPRLFFLHGPAGIGKSDVQLELTRTLAERQIPLLPIRLDSQRPSGSVSLYSREVLELPAEPAQCLAALAGERTAVLLIDQLDALRWTGGHSAEANQICQQIVDTALQVSTVRVVLACRTFDLDSGLNAWERHYADRDARFAQRIEVGLLSEDQVRAFVSSQGARYEDLSSTQRELLRTPYTLFLWWELYRDRRVAPAFVTKTDLLRRYRHRIDEKLEEMRQQEAEPALASLVSYLDRNGRLDGPESLISSPRLLAALQSLNVLRAPRQGQITFAHQSLLDFLIALRIARAALSDGKNPVDWLREREQSLFRRDQLRQLLLILRDDDPPLYARVLAEVITDPGIRFHLRHLALSMLQDSRQPSPAEEQLVRRLLDDGAWRPHVVDQVIARSPVWFGRLDDQGLLALWLSSADEQLVNLALQACRTMADQEPHRIEHLLTPFWEAGAEVWRDRIDPVLGFEAHNV